MRYIIQLWTGGDHAPARLAQLRKRWYIGAGALVVGLSVAIIFSARTGVEAQAVDPTVLDPNLDVRTVVVGPEPAHQYGLPRAQRHPGAGEEHREGAPGGERADPEYGSGPGGQLRLGAGALGDRPAPGFPEQLRGLPVLDGEQHRRGQHRPGQRALAREPGGPLCLEWPDPHVRPQPHQATRVPGRRRAASPGQPQRRRAEVWAGPEALHRHRRQWPARLDAEPPVRADSDLPRADGAG